eukprot:scaffold322_cov109-Isochrysis_galbana.AAC.3
MQEGGRKAGSSRCVDGRLGDTNPRCALYSNSPFIFSRSWTCALRRRHTWGKLAESAHRRGARAESLTEIPHLHLPPASCEGAQSVDSISIKGCVRRARGHPQMRLGIIYYRCRAAELPSINQSSIACACARAPQCAMHNGNAQSMHWHWLAIIMPMATACAAVRARCVCFFVTKTLWRLSRNTTAAARRTP